MGGLARASRRGSDDPLPAGREARRYGQHDARVRSRGVRHAGDGCGNGEPIPRIGLAPGIHRLRGPRRLRAVPHLESGRDRPPAPCRRRQAGVPTRRGARGAAEHEAQRRPRRRRAGRRCRGGRARSMERRPGLVPGRGKPERHLRRESSSGGGRSAGSDQRGGGSPRVSEGRHSARLVLQGHIIDSMMLPQVMDIVMDLGGNFTIEELKVGQHKTDTSLCRMEVYADSAALLDRIVQRARALGATAEHEQPVRVDKVSREGVFPEGFYSTSNLPTEVLLDGRWIAVDNIEMDAAIAVDRKTQRASCIVFQDAKPGMEVVIGHQGVRVTPLERSRQTEIFSFMGSEVSAEKPKKVLIAGIAEEMRQVRDSGGRILVVAGPAVVHTGAGVYLSRLIEHGVEIVLAGSVRDDGPLPDVITDMVEAQRRMRSAVHGVRIALMLSTMLHSIATGNMLPAGVRTVCVDINPAVVTKLADRGSWQSIGLVTDVESFLRELALVMETGRHG